MSIAAQCVSEEAIGSEQTLTSSTSSKPPPKRTATAVADPLTQPEAR